MTPPKTPTTRRILGVDPGTNVLGFAILEARGRRELTIVEMGVLHMVHLKEQYEKLAHIHEELQGIIDRFAPQEMAIEAPFFGKNVQSMLKLGRAQGVAIAAGFSRSLQAVEYAPREIKKAIVGNGAASKEQVAAMLQQQFKQPIDTAYLDATDALATALCHFYRSSGKLGGTKRYKDWGSYLKDNPDKKAR